jgi:hypothetical protein
MTPAVARHSTHHAALKSSSSGILTGSESRPNTNEENSGADREPRATLGLRRGTPAGEPYATQGGLRFVQPVSQGWSTYDISDRPRFCARYGGDAQ